MKTRTRRKIGIVLAAASALLLLPASAGAAFGVKTFEAGTCNTDTPRCSYATETQFFTQIAGHPDFGVVRFDFNTHQDPSGGLVLPDGTIRDVRVDLPSGLSINPQAVPACTEAELETPFVLNPDGSGSGGLKVCESKGARVGQVILTVSLGGAPAEIILPVFNIVPKPGEPAEFGFRSPAVLGFPDITVYLQGTASWEGDYHEGFTIREVDRTLPIFGARLALDGHLGNGSLLTIGSDCHGSTTSTITVDSYENVGVLSSVATTPISPDNVIQPTGCDQVPFEPTISTSSSSATADSPSALSVSVRVPFEPDAPVAQAHLKRAEITLPPGLALNPAAAGKLLACTDGQFPQHVAIGDRVTDPAGVHPPPLACPPESAIGTVAIDTPLLPAGALNGTVYLAQQLSRVPASGDEYRIFLDAEAPRFGVYVRLVGSIAADPATGQLTATFDEPGQGGLPQVPFRSFDLRLDGGGGPLSTPPTCGSFSITSKLSPWSGLAAASPTDSFQLTSAPGPGSCPKTLAERPFAPTFKAALDKTRAASFSPLRIRIDRSDGQQELKGADFTLPAGLTAKLAGVPYCPEAALAAAAGAAGTAERDHPSCSAASRVGSVAILAGTGPSPTRIAGSAYLAGPYRGAPLSVAVITPALAGPFDLGTSVVRVALFVDPETAQIHAVSDPIPDIFGGARLDVRSLALDLDRSQFALAGTSCAPDAASAGALRGGGAAPGDPGSFSSYPVSASLPLSGCSSLGFRPKLRLRLSGATQRTKHPKLHVSLTARPGDANLRSASLALPHALILDQRRLTGVCTRPQFAAERCPARSVYGTAKAVSPLLDKPLTGKIYLRPSNHKLPDLVVHLKGQITIDLAGKIDSFKGGIRTTFSALPDVPISSFSLTLPGGKHGLLQASTNLCKAPPKAVVRLAGQNRKKVGRQLPLKVRCG